MPQLPFSERAQHATNPTAKTLFQLMATKKTNLCVSADIPQADALLAFADAVGPYICVLKTHVDIIEDFTPAFTDALLKLSQKHQFLIFEDRKFADIGNTVKTQYGGGVYHIADWASITNAHILPGPGIIDGLKAVGLEKGNGLLLLAQMSSKGHLMDIAYTEKAIEMAKTHKDFVMGFITQQRLIDDPTFIHMTPGISLATSGDTLGQQYVTPEQAVLENHTDIIIVGRGIYGADDPVNAAKTYQAAAWSAYQERLRT